MRTTESPESTFEALSPVAPDGLLKLIALCRADDRPTKIDLGVGVYRDERGATPVLGAIKAAEAVLAERQPTKSYLGPEGNIGYLERLAPVALGPLAVGAHLYAMQTPGGTGALRLSAELLAAAQPGGRILLGEPAWANHAPIARAAGLKVESYRYFDVATETIRFDEMMAAIRSARPGDAILLQACCHNPTGADLDEAQWEEVAEEVARLGLVPIIDLAYQGLGRSLELDRSGLRTVLESAEDALVAYSCDKNFGLYRERTGALFVVSRSKSRLDVMASHLRAISRASWSMPPDHGAAAVNVVLGSAELTVQWRSELEAMRARIAEMRSRCAAASDHLAFMARQHGMFSLLPLNLEQVLRLRRDFGIYMADSARINVAGLTPSSLEPFARAFALCRGPVGTLRPS